MDFSFQLYSARNFPPLDDVLGRLSHFGYKQVEGFGGLYAEADALAASLKKYGLTMPTGHFGLTQLLDTDAALKTAETLGIKYLYCPAIPKEERENQPESRWVQLGETLAKLGETFRKRGFGFGWHNHAFEFAPLPNGKLPMDILLETAAHNEWEMDVAWVVKGGQDPLTWIKKYRGRDQPRPRQGPRARRPGRERGRLGRCRPRHARLAGAVDRHQGPDQHPLLGDG